MREVSIASLPPNILRTVLINAVPHADLYSHVSRAARVCVAWWRLAQQNQNANKIAEQAGSLYDKFVAFVNDLDEVGQRIDASKKSFEKAHNKLLSGRGNLVKRAESLKQLGARASKKHKPEVLDSAMQSDADTLTPSSDSEDVKALEKKTRH